MRTSLLFWTAVTASGVLALAACGAPSAAPAPTGTVAAAAAPVAAAASDCEDGLPVNATLPPAETLSPGSFGADSTMAKIRERGYLRVATNGDVLNWGATNTKTGDPEGYDVDLAAKVAEALELDPRRTVYIVIPYSQRQKALATDRVDLVAQQMTITCGRWSGDGSEPAINLSAPYYTAGARLLVRTDSKVTGVAGLKGQPVCGTKGSTSLAAVADLGVKPVEALSAGRCLVKFQEGEVAAVVGDETTLAGFHLQDPSSEIVGDALSPGQYGLGTRATAPDFTRFVNGVLAGLRTDGTLDRLYDKWMKPIVGGTSPRIPAPDYRRTTPDDLRTS